MRSSVIYTVTCCSLTAIFGRADDSDEERLIAKADSPWMPDVSRGDRVEIEYDESEDWRGEPVAARKVTR